MGVRRGASGVFATPSQKYFFFSKARFLLDQKQPERRIDSHSSSSSSSSSSSPHNATATTTSTKTSSTTNDAAHATSTPTSKPTQDVVHEDIYNLPNFLTFTRLVAAPAVGYLVLHDCHTWAVALFAYAGVTDMLDGWIARKWNLKTVVGTVIDPMADKTLMTILTVCLAIKGALPVWVAAVILGRDVGLAISAIYYRWISLPPPKTFARYWDFSLPSAEVRPTTISKYNTFLQLALVGMTTAAPLVAADMTPTLTIMQYVVAATTVWSGASYVYTKDAVKILNKPGPKKP
ncbi:CDP-alcohol phosphatidyltransferase-domain-containing protein [Ilyonectria sp. MPI-CAGE-AT-0026]|nr:CDP-alcohol phosphatidyltransferase-domain-containing protein [Ilyonectria sp. MPI-CAGE-AT-0026]